MKDIDQQIALCEWFGCVRDTNSLDVLHEMEKRLTEVQRPAYYGYLWKITQDAQKAFECSSFNLIHASPEQRRKAILQTLNLWREDSNEVGK